MNKATIHRCLNNFELTMNLIISDPILLNKMLVIWKIEYLRCTQRLLNKARSIFYSIWTKYVQNIWTIEEPQSFDRMKNCQTYLQRKKTNQIDGVDYHNEVIME